MKRSISRIAFGAAVLVALVEPVYAEHPSPGPANRIEMLKERLALSDDQANRIAEILTEGRGSCRVHTVRAERKSCRKNMQLAKKTEIESVLTEAQKLQFAQLRQERAERRHGRKKDCN